MSNPWAVHPRADPRLADERRVMGRHGSDLGLGKLQCDLAALDLVHGGEKAAVPALGEQRLQEVAVDRLSHDRRRGQRQPHERAADVGRDRRRQSDHVKNQRGAIVGAAGVEGGRHERAGGGLRSRPLAQGLADAVVGQDSVHPVAAQEKAVVQGDRLRCVVEARLRLDAERASKHARSPGPLLPRMIGGETG